MNWKWLLLLTLVAAGLRLFNLLEPSIVSDELSSIHDALDLYHNLIEASLRIVRIVGYLPFNLGLYLNGIDLNQIGPESYAIWIEQGVDPWSMRMIPVIIGTLSIPILTVASRHFLGNTASLVFGLLLAFMPWHIKWSQFARFYVMQLLFYSLGLIYYYKGTREKSHWHLALSMMMITLSFLCQFTSAVFFFVIGADWVINQCKKVKTFIFDRHTYVIIGLTAILLAALLSLSFWMNFDGWNQNFIHSTERKPLEFFSITLKKFGPFLIIAALSSLLFWKDKVKFLLLAAIIPLLIISLLSFRAHSGPRYAFMCVYPILALAGITVQELKSTLGRPAALTTLTLLLASFYTPLLKHYSEQNPSRRPYNKIASYIRQNHKKGEKVLFYSPKVAKYYLGDLGPDLLSSSMKITESNHGIWIVLREHETSVLNKHPILSKAKLVKTFTVRKSKKRPKEVKIYYQTSEETANFSKKVEVSPCDTNVALGNHS